MFKVHLKDDVLEENNTCTYPGFPIALKRQKTSRSQILLRLQKTLMKKSAMERILNSLLLTPAFVAIYTNKTT